MKDTEIIKRINEFSEVQKAEYNILSENKTYTIEQGEISELDLEEAQSVSEAVNSLSQSYIDENIFPKLDSKNKLSQRPC